MNTEMNREMQYKTVEMAEIVTRNVPMINKKSFTTALRKFRKGGFFAFDAPDRTGKTYLISLVLAKIR
jgi:hypothetical protein